MSWIDRVLPGLAAYGDVHPMVVHFPAALFPVALLLAWVALLRRKSAWASTARLLLLLGTLGAAASIATGLMAEKAMPHGSGTVVSVHRTFMIVVGVLALVLSVAAFRYARPPEGTELRILCAGLVLLNVLLVLGADRGALVALARRTGVGEAPQRSNAPLAEPIPATEEGDPTRGEELYARLECASCHRAGAEIESPGIPPTLAYAGSMLREDWTTSYLLRPGRIRWADHGERPLVRMPDFQLAPAEAADLSAYLATRIDSARFPSTPIVAPPLAETDAREGRDLVGRYACRGCHVIEGAGDPLGPNLDSVGDRLQPGYIYAFLMDPKGIIPNTPMRDFGLWKEEARSITAYLMTMRKAEELPSGEPSGE